MKVYRQIPPCDPALIEAAGRFSVADLHESMDSVSGRQALFDNGIRPLNIGQRIAGQAVTVYTFPGDGLLGHKAVSLLQPGNILVGANGGSGPQTMFAELVSLAATQRGAAGVVVDGCVRDSEALRRSQFPVWSTGYHVGRTGKVGPGAVNIPIICGGVRVEPGDVIVADEDGVICLTPSDLPAILERAQVRAERETKVRAAIAGGQTLFDLLGLQAAVDAAGIEEIDGTWRSG